MMSSFLIHPPIPVYVPHPFLLGTCILLLMVCNPEIVFSKTLHENS